MKTIITRISALAGIVILSTVAACTDLDEELYGSRSVEVPGASTPAELGSVYDQLNGQVNTQNNTYALQEHATDEMMGPTRGTDWGDFGLWRKLHQHTWDAAHTHVTDAWDDLNTGVFRATQVADAASATPQTKAEASFLRAWFMFQITDLYGQQPFRDPASGPDEDPRVMTRPEAVDFMINDLNFAEATLQPTTSLGTASQAAAQALLAKIYLNRAVYTAATVGGPFTFAAEDMNKVIENANKIIASGRFQLTDSYFDNFSWDNSALSRENIFGIENSEARTRANHRRMWRMTIHYRQTPDGWNGFTTLADFYASFEPTDERRGGSYPGLTDKIGLRTGFLIGQQFGPGGVALQQRSGQPLIFTENVNLNYSTEAQGIRVVKYFPKPEDNNTVNDDNIDNDWAFLRYADVLLMKAEAIMRGGTDPMGQTALSIVNTLRASRGASLLATVDEAAMLAERGRELYWEGWRRNDQIRFGTFNDPVDQRPTASDKTRTVYPIPQKAVDTNPNLVQNEGY